MSDSSQNEIEKHVDNLRFKTCVNAGMRFEGEPSLQKVCAGCGRQTGDIARRRLNTAYANDAFNYAVCCSDCYEEAVAYYQDLWDAYYSDCF